MRVYAKIVLASVCKSVFCKSNEDMYFYATEVDDCTSSSCDNGGDCQDQHLGFTCDCEGTGYTGDRCQTGN